MWQRTEFRITGVPVVTNPFDPDLVRVDVEFTAPSGTSMVVPAFWYQDFERRLTNGRETLQTTGPAEWRARFTPQEPGLFTIALTIRTNGVLQGGPVTANFNVATASSAGRNTGNVRIAQGTQYFETSDGRPLKLIGHNVCWHHQRGTYDYDEWFNGLRVAGENFARLWMWPHAFGLEADKDSRTRYRLDRAWQLDYVFDLAERSGIYLLLCLDYHGMFLVEPDSWGGNNYWPSHPYNVTNGGPCLNQNGFFTNTTAHVLYQKRLRYLVARYGYSPNLLAWEFFNEIDNAYSYLKPADVASWHGIMGRWLKANDPFGHLVTTSLTGSSDRPEIWSVPELDFAAYHSYNEASPASRMAAVAQSFLSRYRKPMMIGEFGVDWRGWQRETDPHLRGFRQALWGGALGGSVGSSMSWWWENIHSENAYTNFQAMRRILDGTAWAQGAWTNVAFRTAGAPPSLVADAIPGGSPFDAHLAPNSGWGSKPSGRLGVANPSSAGYAAGTLNAFVHGSAHTDLRNPFLISAWVTNNARLVLHLNSVSSGATLVVRADGKELYRTNLPNLDAGWNVNNEYNMDIAVNLPPGKKLIEIANAGSDWFYLDWVRLEQVLPSAYQNNWQPSPESVGIRSEREALVYVVAPGASYPAGATNAVLPLQEGQSIVLTNWPGGKHISRWYLPSSGQVMGTTESVTTNGVLTLPLPGFREDLTGVIFAAPQLKSARATPEGLFEFVVESETGGTYQIEQSSDLSAWSPLVRLTNVSGAEIVRQPLTNEARFFRATLD